MSNGIPLQQSTRYQAKVSISSEADIQRRKDPANFLIRLKNPLRNVRRIDIESVILPNSQPLTDAYTIRWSMLEDNHRAAGVLTTPGDYASIAFNDNYGDNKTIDLALYTTSTYNLGHDRSFQLTDLKLDITKQSDLNELALLMERRMSEDIFTLPGAALTNYPHLTYEEYPFTADEKENQFQFTTSHFFSHAVDTTFAKKYWKPKIRLRVNSNYELEIYTNFRFYWKRSGTDNDFLDAFGVVSPSNFVDVHTAPNLAIHRREHAADSATLAQEINGLGGPADHYSSSNQTIIDGLHFLWRTTSRAPLYVTDKRHLMITSPSLSNNSQVSINSETNSSRMTNVLAQVPIQGYMTHEAFGAAQFNPAYVNISSLSYIEFKLYYHDNTQPEFARNDAHVKLLLNIWYDGH